MMLFAAGVHLMHNDASTFDFGKGKFAVCTIKVRVEPGQWDRFFADIRKFADLNKFGARIAYLKPEKDIVYIDLWRPDTAVAGENVFEPSDFDLCFYVDPSKGGTRDAALSLANRLGQELRQIPGASVEVEEKTD